MSCTKIVVIMLIFALALFTPLSVAFADNGEGQWEEYVGPIIELLTAVVNFLLQIAGGVFVIFMIINSFKFATSSGRPDRRADAVGAIGYNFIGAIICFGAAYLVGLAENLVQDLPGVGDEEDFFGYMDTMIQATKAQFFKM